MISFKHMKNKFGEKREMIKDTIIAVRKSEDFPVVRIKCHS